MKKFLIIVGSIVVLVIVALLVAPFVIPVESYKPELLARIESATGREARIDGDFRISLLPRVEFVAGDVSLANAPGGEATNLVTLERLDVGVELFPLLGGNVVVDTFVLTRPEINLEVDRQGNPNWQLAGGQADGEPAASGDRPAGEKGGMGLSGLQLGDVRLVDGKVTYSDARTGASHTVDDIDMTISLPSMTSPMEADGSMVWKEEEIALKLGVRNPNAFLTGESTPLAASISATPLKLSFEGEASQAEQIRASGTLDLDVPSIRRLADWAGQPLTAPGDGFGPLRITGQVGVDGQKYSFTQAELALDEITAAGDFRFDGSGRKPYLNARLETGVLDINPYLPPEQAAAEGADKPASGDSGGPAAQGWSDEPIDLAALRQVDLDAVLQVAGLRVRKIEIGKSRVQAALKNGKLTTELTEMTLYEGSGKATLIADASSDTPAVSAAMTLSGLQAGPALQGVMEFDRLEGTLNSELDITTLGKSQRAMVSALRGDGNVRFTDGAIRGINLAAMVRNVRSAFLDPGAREQQKTDFSELSGTFRIAEGIVRNDDLVLLSPLLRVTGKGTVDLPDRTVDYRIEPKVVASTTGQGGSAEKEGIAVPVIVSGPWSNLSYNPDLSGAIEDVVKDPAKAVDELKKMLPGAGSQGGSSGEKEGSGGGSDPADTIRKLFER